jgi:hypothetical protein
MNEIILAPCDAGYVQSCTGFLKPYFVLLFTYVNIYINNPKINNMVFFCVVHLQGEDTPSTEGIVAWRVI